MSQYSPGRPGRESHDAIGVDADGEEHVLPALVAGPGMDLVNPEPGTQGWIDIVQAGINSAAAADPPNSQELALWRRVSEELLPLDFVQRDDMTLTLRVPSWWRFGPESPEATATVAISVRPVASPTGVDAVSLQANVTRLLIHALDEAPITVTLSRHVERPIHQGTQYVYPMAHWAQIVEAALEEVAAQLLPEEDGVVIGHVDDEDLVAQALELLARAGRGKAP